MSRARPSLWNWSTHTTIAHPLTRSAVREGFNLPLLSHRAWHSAERPLFRESIRGKIKLVPSAPSPLASLLQSRWLSTGACSASAEHRSISASNRNINCLIWKLFTTHRLPVFFIFLSNSDCSLYRWSIDIFCRATHSEIPCIITFYVTLWMRSSVCAIDSRNTAGEDCWIACVNSVRFEAWYFAFSLLC